MYYEVGYDVGDGIYSVNIIEGGEAITKMVADEHAKKHGYKVAYITKVDEVEVESKRAKGMPVIDAFDYFFSKRK